MDSLGIATCYLVSIVQITLMIVQYNEEMLGLTSDHHITLCDAIVLTKVAYYSC